MIPLIVAVFLILLLLYVAALYESVSLASMAFLLLGLVVMSYVLIVWRLAAVEVDISIPMALSVGGQPTGVHFTMNAKRKIFGRARLRVLVKGRQLPAGRFRRTWIRLEAPSFGSERVRKEVTMHCSGGYEYRLGRLRIYDWTGWFYLTRRLDQSATTLLLPKVHELPVQLSYAVKNFLGESEVYDDLRGGSDTAEVFQIRSYQPGDRLQNIHWKLSVKSEDLMVREYSLPKGCPVVLLLGTKGSGKQKPALRDRFLQIAASVSFALVDAGCPHIVSWYDASEGDLVRMRVDDEECFYEWQMRYLQAACAAVDVEAAYMKKYENELYLHRLCVEPTAEVRLDGNIWKKFAGKDDLEKELASLQLLL